MISESQCFSFGNMSSLTQAATDVNYYCGHHAITVPKLANMLFSPLVRMREPWTTTRALRLVIL